LQSVLERHGVTRIEALGKPFNAEFHQAMMEIEDPSVPAGTVVQELIFDEALAVGDALFQKRCFARINRLVDDGVTILFVSHDQETVRTVTRRALLLHEGGAVALGTSSETLLAYRRLINREESKYFASLAQANVHAEMGASVVAEAPAGTGDPISIEETVVAIAPANDPEDTTVATSPFKDESANTLLQEADVMREAQDDGTAKKSFGAGYAFVTKVATFDSGGEPCAVFYPGEIVRIKMECRSDVALKNLNVSLRIRNREGLKVYSWGTLNQDMRVYAGLADGPTFWNRHVHAGEEFSVWFEFECPLGPGFYEIQGAISHEGAPDYSDQTILHWKDEAAFFQVFMDQKSYYFGGSFDLKMRSKW
jgi:lipopolysaccharide transport system ATP-binding protein